jgi:hypothetical protein
MEAVASMVIPAPVNLVTVASGEEGGVWLVVVVFALIVRSRRERNHGRAVRERRDDRNLNVDEDARDTEVEFVIGIICFAEMAFAIRFIINVAPVYAD